MRSAFDTVTGILSLSPIPDQHGILYGQRRRLILLKASGFGFIEPSYDSDYFRFSAQASNTYMIEVALDGHPETVVTLYQAKGLQVEQNDDAEGMEEGSRIIWTASSTGVYFI